MHHCDYDWVKFVNHALNPVCIEWKVTEVEFVYLHQIVGPSFPDIPNQSVLSHKNDVFVDMWMNPDTWMNQYVDTDLTLEYLMNFCDVFTVLLLGHGMIHAFHLRRKAFP